MGNVWKSDGVSKELKEKLHITVGKSIDGKIVLEGSPTDLAAAIESFPNHPEIACLMFRTCPLSVRLQIAKSGGLVHLAAALNSPGHSKAQAPFYRTLSAMAVHLLENKDPDSFQQLLAQCEPFVPKLLKTLMNRKDGLDLLDALPTDWRKEILVSCGILEKGVKEFLDSVQAGGYEDLSSGQQALLHEIGSPPLMDGDELLQIAVLAARDETLEEAFRLQEFHESFCTESPAAAATYAYVAYSTQIHSREQVLASLEESKEEIEDSFRACSGQLDASGLEAS